MTQLHLEKQVVIRASAQRVYSELVDLERHIGLQPYLTAVDILDRDEGSDSMTFVATERLPIFFGLAWSNRITIRALRPQPGKSVTFVAISPPGIRVHCHFEIAEQAGDAHVTERLEVEVPRLLRGYVGRRVDAAHSQLLVNLKQRLEGSPAAG